MAMPVRHDAPRIAPAGDFDRLAALLSLPRGPSS